MALRQRILQTSARTWNLLAVALMMALAIGIVFAPLGSTSSEDSAGGPEVITRSSLFADEGPRILLVVAVPVAIVALPFLFSTPRRAHRARAVATGLLVPLALLGAASIGGVLLPVLAFMVLSLAAFQPPAESRPKGTGPTNAT